MAEGKIQATFRCKADPDKFKARDQYESEAKLGSASTLHPNQLERLRQKALEQDALAWEAQTKASPAPAP